jgi:polyribonucleotide nucleotidyltransferase
MSIPTTKEYSLELGSETLIVKTGNVADQANASVLCQMGDTVCLANCTVSPPKEDKDFLPLQVIYQEKYYAGGKIAGSRFRKREGRPADEFVLLGRMIDRGLRAMFPKELRHDIQIFCTVLSYDFEHEHDVTSANAANLAVTLSDCPCEGPLGSVRVGLIGGELVLNPSREARERSDLDMFVTTSLDKIVMIEAGANQVPEADILRAIAFGKKWAQKIARLFADIQKEIGKAKFTFDPPYEHPEAFEFLKAWALPIVTKAIKDPLNKLTRRKIFNDLMQQAQEKLKEKYPAGKAPEEELAKLYAHGASFIDQIITAEVRRLILEEGVRVGSRAVNEIRPLSAMVDVLPQRVHGSALFQRGETQILTTCTLGGPGDKLIIEGMEGEQKRRYMHHYNFPPFSVGETGGRGMPGIARSVTGISRSVHSSQCFPNRRASPTPFGR